MAETTYRTDILHLPTLMYVTLKFVALCVEDTLGSCLQTPTACSQHQSWATACGNKQVGLAHHPARLAYRSWWVSKDVNIACADRVQQVQQLRVCREDAVFMLARSKNSIGNPKEPKPAGAHVQVLRARSLRNKLLVPALRQHLLYNIDVSRQLVL